MHGLALCITTLDWSEQLWWLLVCQGGRCFHRLLHQREPSLRPIFDKILSAPTTLTAVTVCLEGISNLALEVSAKGILIYRGR